MRVRANRERLRRILKALTPDEPSIGLQINGYLSPDDLATWIEANPDGEVLEVLLDGGGLVVFERLMA